MAFGVVLAAVTLFGLSLKFVPLDPAKARFWSAVINCFVAVPIMIALMMVVSGKKQMKEFMAPSPLSYADGRRPGDGSCRLAMLLADARAAGLIGVLLMLSASNTRTP